MTPVMFWTVRLLLVFVTLGSMECLWPHLWLDGAGCGTAV